MWNVPSRKRWPAPDSRSLGENSCRLEKWTMPSLPRSRSVSIRGRPPVRSRKKLLSRRRTQALALPTTCEPLLFGPGTTFRSVITSTIPRPGIRNRFIAPDAITSNRPVTRSISRESLPFHRALVSFKFSPRTSLGVIVSQPSIRGLASIAPATSPMPVIARAWRRSGTRIGQGVNFPRPSARTSTKPVSSNFTPGEVSR